RFRVGFGGAPPLRIHLEKNLPTGAGLGGGSSDAATVLRALARLTDIPADEPKMLSLAASLGSDVPFFLHEAGNPQPVLATGRGEVLHPLPVDLPFALVIATPDVSISTADAYAGITPDDRDRPSLTEVVEQNAPERWRDTLANDFEPFIFSAFPQLSAIQDTVYGSGAFYASLRGTGSSVYGLFEDEAVANGARGVLASRGVASWGGFVS